jgi:hypothetical protein
MTCIEMSKRQAVIQKTPSGSCPLPAYARCAGNIPASGNPAWLMDAAKILAGWSNSRPAERRSTSSCGFEKASEQSLHGCREARAKCTTSHLRVTVWSRVARQTTGLGAIARGGQCPSSNGHEQNVVAIINLLQTAALQCQHPNENLRSPWPRSHRISSCMR